MATKFTRNSLKRMLINTINKIQPLPEENASLSKKDNKILMGNERVIKDLNKALQIFDKDFNKACELICNLPYQMVGPHSEINLKQNPIVGSDAAYSRTDTLRHYVRMLPETDFSNSKVWLILN